MLSLVASRAALHFLLPDTTCLRDANYLTSNVGIQDNARRVLNAGIWLYQTFSLQSCFNQSPIARLCDWDLARVKAASVTFFWCPGGGCSRHVRDGICLVFILRAFPTCATQLSSVGVCESIV